MANSTQTADGSGMGQEEGGELSETVLLRTTPTVKPVVVKLGLSLAIGILAMVTLYTNPELLGSRETTNIGLVVVQLLLIVAIVRLVVKIIVLLRTEYVVTDKGVRRGFELLARSKSREVPYALVRSHERNQTRIEYILNAGSVSLNQGLGDLKLEYLSDHDEVYGRIRKRVDDQ